MNKAA
jgi:hypothetical protein